MRLGTDSGHVTSSAVDPSADARAWIAMVLSDGRQAIGPGDRSIETLLTVATEEDVLPLLERRLRDRDGWQLLPQPFRDRLASAARAAAVTALFREREIRRIAKALADAGARALLLKGNALGLWLYSQPYLRTTSDIDLLAPSRSDAMRAREAFEGLGYTMDSVPGSMIHEMKGRLIVDGVSRSEIDLHDRLLNAPLYAGVFSFDELWNGAVEMPSLGEALKVLAPSHAFAHACMNRALDVQLSVPDRLKLLYDVHLFCADLDRGGWARQLELLRQKGISGSCLLSIADAMHALGSRVPEQVLAELASQAEGESLDWRRFRDWRYMQWRNLRALPDFSSRIIWLWQRLAPSRHHLQDLYGESNRWKQMSRRMGRLLNRLHGD